MHLTLVEPGVWTATPAVAQRFGISVHHLQKIAQTLVRAGIVEARQGRSGGVRLARDPRDVRLGRLVAELEGVGEVIDCRRDPCPLIGRCRLKWAFDAAEQAFFRELDRLTLADVAAGPTELALRALFRGDPEARVPVATAVGSPEPGAADAAPPPAGPPHVAPGN